MLEGRTAGLLADRLRGFAMLLHLVHPMANSLGLRDLPAIQRRGEDDRRIDTMAAVDELHVRIAEREFLAAARDAMCLHQHVPGLAAIGACIHALRAADRTRNSVIEF